MNRKIDGFTLIELMIVIAIMGIMSTIAIPTYFSYTERAKITESLAMMDEIKKSITTYYHHRRKFPANNTAAGLPKPDLIIGNYVKRVDVEKGAIHVQFGNFVSKHLQGKVLSLRPLTVNGSPRSPISWACGWHPNPEGMEFSGENRTNVNNVLLPVICRGAGPDASG